MQCLNVLVGDFRHPPAAETWANDVVEHGPVITSRYRPLLRCSVGSEIFVGQIPHGGGNKPRFLSLPLLLALRRNIAADHELADLVLGEPARLLSGDLPVDAELRLHL